jgi:uncharacterized protein (TIGR03437 family)
MGLIRMFLYYYLIARLARAITLATTRTSTFSALRFALLALFATAAFAQTYTASTFAGVFVPENLPAASVGLNEIGGVAIDSNGNVFLSLPYYAVVMRLDATTGILTRFAGNATNGFSGDNGPAVNSQVYNPGALAVDAAGNLYIVDAGNYRIRKVSNGIITTVAGNGNNGFSGDNGPATSAQLYYPHALARDSTGNLYISDSTGVIRKVSNGVITSVPGAQGFFAGIAVDAAGNLYLLDAVTPRVLKLANGVATTIAGNGTYGFSGDDGPATSAQFGGDTDDGGPSAIAADSAGTVYIADSYNGRIRKVSSGVITTVAQSAFPTLVDATAGTLYIADVSNSTGFLGTRLLKFANGATTTLAGNGSVSFGGDGRPAAGAQFYQPEGIAIDSAGRMYVADTQNNRVRMIANGVVTTIAGTGIQGYSGDNGPAAAAQLATPVSVAVDPAGSLYIADLNNYRVRKISDGVISTVAGTVGVRACGVAADAAGNVYVSDCLASRVLKVTNGIAMPVAVSGHNYFSLSFHPTGLAVDSAGNLYMTNAGAILKLSNGVLTTVTGGTGVAFDSTGNLYVADGNLGLIRKFSNGTIADFPMSPPLAFPGYGIAVDSSGNVYGSDGIHILALKPTGTATPPLLLSVDFVNNAASNAFLGISPGEIVTLRGSGLGPAQPVSAKAGSDGFYPTQLSGTAVHFNGIAAPLLYASSTQIAAVAPYGVTGPSVQAVVTYQDQISVSLTMQVSASTPGLFTADGTGTGQAAAINQDGTKNSVSNPAPIGSVISLYATGGGPTSPLAPDGQVSASPLSKLTLPVSVSIGGSLLSPAQLQYAGPAPGEIAGVMQLNVPLLPGLTTGSSVPVAIVVGNASSSYQSVTISVGPTGK